MNQTDNNKEDLVMGGREWAMLLTLAVLWGASFFFFRVMVTELPTFTVVLGRVGIAALLMNVWLILRRDYMSMSAGSWGAFAIMATLNNVIPFSLIAFGETRISGGLASILNATTPMFTILVAQWLTKNEKLTVSKAVGLATGFVGVAVIVGPNVISGVFKGGTVGELACLSAAISYAFAGVYGRRFKNMNPIKVATGQITAGTVILLPLVAILDQPWTLPMPSAGVWGATFGIAILCTVIAYILYFRILAAAGATNLLLVTMLVPVSALILSWAILSEKIAYSAFGGMALIGLGLAFIDGRLPKKLYQSASHQTT